MPPSVSVAIALDTVAAASAAELVSRVVVVTDEPSWAPDLDADLVLQRNPGLNGAVMDALATLDTGPTAVLLGDVAALRAPDLDEALATAADVDTGFVTDESGTGTVLLTARKGISHTVRFGVGSAARHAAHGYRPLPTREGSTLRLDIDTRADLARAQELGVGPQLGRALTALSTSELVR